MDDGVREERGERAEKRRHHEVLKSSQEDQVRMERDKARHAHEVQGGRWHWVRDEQGYGGKSGESVREEPEHQARL